MLQERSNRWGPRKDACSPRAPLRACRQDFDVCLLYERHLPFKRAGPRSSFWNALEATVRWRYVAPRKVGYHWTEHRRRPATSISTTLGRTLRIMGIMWHTCVEASGLRRLDSNITGRLQTQAFAARTHATTTARLPRKSRGDLRCKIRSLVADLLIFKMQDIQVKCGRRVAWGRMQSRNRRSPSMTISRRRRVALAYTSFSWGSCKQSCCIRCLAQRSHPTWKMTFRMRRHGATDSSSSSVPTSLRCRRGPTPTGGSTPPRKSVRRGGQ